MIAICLSAWGMPARLMYRACTYQNQKLSYGREHLWAVKLENGSLVSICGGKDWDEILSRIGKGESARLSVPFETSDWVWSGPEKIEDRRMMLEKVERAHENPGTHKILSNVQRAMIAISTEPASAASGQKPRL